MVVLLMPGAQQAVYLVVEEQDVAGSWGVHFLQYIKLLKAIVVSLHKEEPRQHLLYVCCVYECIYNGATITSPY